MNSPRYEIKIRSRLRDYQAEIHDDLSFLDELSALPHAAFLIDRKVFELYHDVFQTRFESKNIYFLDAQETNKTLEEAGRIYDWLISHFTAKRNLNFISIGGGITQDVSGFVASTLYRGIHWYYVPTTLLAQVDSCIGGKTSLNFGHHKNLLGTFYPPQQLFLYPGFAGTLTALDRSSGYGEIIKFLLMEGFENGKLDSVAERMKQIAAQQKNLSEAIFDSLNIKRSFMEDDEFDLGRRNLLNYGHCFGHALEASSSYYVPHGVAVNIGIQFANLVATHRNTLSAERDQMIRDQICMPYLIQPQREQDYDEERLLENLKNDKKRVGEGLPMVIPVKDGLCRIQDLTPGEFLEALSILKNRLFPVETGMKLRNLKGKDDQK